MGRGTVKTTRTADPDARGWRREEGRGEGENE